MRKSAAREALVYDFRRYVDPLPVRATLSTTPRVKLLTLFLTRVNRTLARPMNGWSDGQKNLRLVRNSAVS
jgi:hypothetical protein